MRQLGAEVRNLGQEGCCSQGRIRADCAALTLLPQSCLALLIGLQRTEGPNGAIAQSVRCEAVFLGDLRKGQIGILAGRESLRQLLKGWNKWVHRHVLMKRQLKPTLSPPLGSLLSTNRRCHCTGQCLRSSV